MNTDLTFIINENENNLKKRFEVLIKDSIFFDCLVGYFYLSGFHEIYKSLENTEKIRILIGINTNPETYNLIKNNNQFSHSETKELIEEPIVKELADCEDNNEIETGIIKLELLHFKWVKYRYLVSYK